MVTVAILSILSSITFRSFRTFLVEQKLKASTIEAAGFFRTARTYAMKKGETCTVGTTATSPLVFGITSNTTVAPCTFTQLVNPANETGLNALSTNTLMAVTFTPQGFVAGSIELTTVILKTEGITSMGCIGISAPSGIVRVGWKNSESTPCDFTKGE